MRSWAGLVTAFLVAVVAHPAEAASWSKRCHDRFRLGGVVLDAAGRPARDATAWVLLDEVSEKKFRERGMRGRKFRSGSDGRWAGEIDCAAHREAQEPNPCASKPKHLTVAVDGAGPGLRMRMRVFRLDELSIDEQAAGCVVEVPELRLPGP